MISSELARALRDSGLVWKPQPGDAFLIDRVEADTDVFYLSELTIEAHDYPTGTELGFNGTTEWALDSVALEDTLWLPHENQLRERLGAAFVALRPGWTVSVVIEGAEQEFDADDPADAYGRALLHLLDSFRVE